MNMLPSRRHQRGYLMEIPILFVIIVIVLSVLLPELSRTGQKIAVGIAAIPILFALFYMIVIPGWTPGNEGRLKWPWNWLVFLLIATPIAAVVVLFILS